MLYRFCCATVIVLIAASAASASQGSVRGLTLSDTTVEAGTTVRATATGTSPCGAVHIDWGDGTIITYATETLPVTQTHAYAHGGTFNLRAQGMGNCTGEATARIVVNGRPAPPPTLTRVDVSDDPIEPRAATEITLDGTGPCRVTLDFGDGNRQEVRETLPATVRHTYTAPGRYTVAATAQAPCEGRRTASIEVAARAQPQITGLSVDQPADAPPSQRAITVHGSGRCAYQLAFGDGNTDSRNVTLPDTVQHNYPAAGRYTAIATARPPCRGSFEWTFAVEGRPTEPQAEGRISGVSVRPQTIAVGEPVTITIAGSGTCRFVVDFHDGQARTLTERLPHRLTYVYRQPRDYTIVAWSHEPCLGEGDALVRVRRGDAR